MSAFGVLAAIAGVLALPALFNLARRPELRRIAVRNIVRRPVESTLIVVGSALGTAIIVAALLVGDTFDRSIRDIARTSLGEVDQTVEFDSPQAMGAGLMALQQADLPDTDGIMAIRDVHVAAAGAGSGDSRKVEPKIVVSGLDFDAVGAFGGQVDPSGLAELAKPPSGNQIVINDELAADLGLVAGDAMSLFLGGTQQPFEVIDVVDAVGLGGYSDGFVSLAVLDRFDPTGTSTRDHLAISNRGGVFDSLAPVDQVMTISGQALGAAGLTHEVNRVKQDLLLDAELEGEELTRIFSVVGGFSVLAGVLLLINLFVMLADERKPNLGVLRAIGWRRAALRRAFRCEGVVYASVASVLGAVLGVGVGWVIVQLTKGILAGANPDSDFVLLFTVDVSSLITAALTGLVIAMGAITFTSWRISRLNIISAIRDLPEPGNRRSRVAVLVAGLVTVALGGLMLAAGVSGDNAFLALSGVPVAVMGAALVAKRYLAPTVVAGLGGVLTVLWGICFFPLMPDAMTRDVDITFFLLFGVVIVAGGVAITTVLGPSIQRLFAIGNRPMVAARVAMAYPAARMFRTAASLAMYSLIIFTLAFMAVLSNSFSLQASDIARSTAAGHDIIVDSNRSNPIPLDQLREVEGVVVASPLMQAKARFSAEFEPASEDDPEQWSMVGVGPDFAKAGAPTLRDRAERFRSDEQALAALAEDPSLIMVPTWFLGSDDGIEPSLGTTVTARSASAERVFEIIGVIENDYAWSGPWLAATAVRDLDPSAAPTRTYVVVADGVDAAEMASTIEARFLPNGAEAETFVGRVQRFVEADQGFFSLLRGYLLLGLVIGIAGLAVSLFRAVRERRRQIGMMRAMGLSARGVRQWFLTEATFVSLMGIVTGVGLGLLTGYLVVTRSTAFDGAELPFGVPWAVVVFIVGVPFVASAMAAVIPARRAALLRPSEALRLAD